MSDQLFKPVERVESPDVAAPDAIRAAVETAARRLRRGDGFEPTAARGQMSAGRLGQVRVGLKAGFPPPGLSRPRSQA